MSDWRDRDPDRLELQRIRAESEEKPCLYCGVPAGEPCINKATGKPLRRLPAHQNRLEGVDV